VSKANWRGQDIDGWPPSLRNKASSNAPNPWPAETKIPGNKQLKQRSDPSGTTLDAAIRILILFVARHDRPNLQPLPAEPYVIARWKRSRVAPDYHIEVERCWYSVPFSLIREVVDARITHS
jgi:hypothetical protein